jgi:hypothetical protein
MPGYRSLSSHISGTAAEHAREAEIRQRGGDSEAAARLLEEALEASMRVRPELPGWICGRLASIYRTLKRYDDEVMLLERYRESQTSEEARTRFDARLSKARAIADRKRRPETGALATVRQVRTRSSLRRRTPVSTRILDVSASSAPGSPGTPGAASFSPRHLYALRAALIELSPERTEMLRDAMTGLCEDAREMDAPVESLVSALRTCWIEEPKPASLNNEEWHERYASALIELLAIHFGETT